MAAVDHYRRADSASKTTELAKVANVACTDPQVCGAKVACVAALVPDARALAIKDDVAHRLADIEQKRLSADTPDAQALPGKLDAAERLLNEARVKMPECEKRLTDLQVLYGV